MANKYLLGVDFGTTGTRSIIYDLQGNELGNAYKENIITYPEPGSYEYDGHSCAQVCYETTALALKRSGIDPRDIAAVSFSAIRGCFGMYDENDEFVHPLILWPDNRSLCKVPWMEERLAALGITHDDLYDLTLFPFSPGWPSARILYFKDRWPEKWERVKKIGSLQTVVQKIYGGDSNLDDAEDVGWFQQHDAVTCKPLPQMQEAWGIPSELFAKFVPTGTVIGKVSRECAEQTGLIEGTPLVCGSGDQECMIVGTGCTESGTVSTSIGTCGCIIVRSDELHPDPSRKLNICGSPGGAWQMEGTTSAAGQGYRWFRDALCQPEIGIAKQRGMDVYDMLNELAEEVPAGCNGLMFLPYLVGAETPKFNRFATGAFLGCNIEHRKGAFVRAVMEGACYELKAMLEVFRQSGLTLAKHRFSSGGSRSALWNQILADVYNEPITNVATSEATGLGAAMIAAVGVGLYNNYEEAAKEMVRVTKTWEPNPENVKIYEEGYALMQDAYETLTQNNIFRRIYEFNNR